MKRKRTEKIWGWEEEIVNDLYCGKVMLLSPFRRCSMHYHKNKDETFLCLSGSFTLELDDYYVVMNPMDSFRIEPGVNHRFWGDDIRPATFVEFSTHHEDSDSYRSELSGSFSGKNIEDMISKKERRDL
jgi:mannose-6-phosphate isomerase-like protein (cupin superfamily)